MGMDLTRLNESCWHDDIGRRNRGGHQIQEIAESLGVRHHLGEDNSQPKSDREYLKPAHML